MRYSLKSLTVCVLVSGFAIGSAVSYRSYFRPTGSGATASVANRVMWQELKLPTSASDVTYYVDSGGCEAEFAIAEPDFLELCRQKGWDVRGIESPAPYFEPVLLPRDSRLVNEGYTFSLPDGEGVYDSKRSRAAFYVSTFP